MGNVIVVVGAMFGSEAKGAVAAQLSRMAIDPVGVRVGGPNAGHTVLGACPPGCNEHPGSKQDHPWRLRQVPVLAVSRTDATLIIAAGSEVDPKVLAQEVEELDAAGYDVSRRLIVDRNATVIEKHHIHIETNVDLTGRIGSTGKGIGAARSDRLMRKAKRVMDLTGEEAPEPIKTIALEETSEILTRELQRGATVIIEGTQGYGLGLHTRFYPTVTSGNCRAIDFLAQAGISPWSPFVHSTTVWLVARTRPIRVAGNSGPLFGETTWEELGLPEEHTTVTKKVRRVGAWDVELVNDAIEANGGPGPNVKLALTMVDYEMKEVTDLTDPADLTPSDQRKLGRYLQRKNAELSVPISIIGTGPATMMNVEGLGNPAVGPMGLVGAVRQAVHSAMPTVLRPDASVIHVPDVSSTGPTPGDTTTTSLTGHVWIGEQGPEPVDREELERMSRRLAATRNDRIVLLDSESDDKVGELRRWWLERADSEVEPLIKKAMEYGGEGAALDLIQIGQDLARIAGNPDPSIEEATELGIFFYLRGKLARWTAAVTEGRRVSDDTLHDIGVYCRMAQRTRAVGGWPFGPMGEGS